MDECMRDASAALERCGRSVLDYNTPEELRQALEERSVPADGPCATPPPGKSDWRLPVPDPDAEPESVENEMQRLLTLKSYLILDQAKEEAFDALTREACQVYNVPTSLVSLIDLGRQFLFSNTGADVRETPRTPAFCAHTILSKTGICVVPDTILDQRFRNNCLVTGGPKLRFYAGAPLISPEGYKLGTFCVEGPDPRPEGLSDLEQAKLKEFAARAMDFMVDRRRTMQRAHELVNHPEHAPLRRHAAVTTNLGSLVYKHYLAESVLAMCLFQESVQTLMRLEDHPDVIEQLLPAARKGQMSNLLDAMNQAATNPEQRDQVVNELRTLYPDASGKATVPIRNLTSVHKIPGTFGMSSKLKGSPQLQLQGLFFSEAFDVSLTPADETNSTGPGDPHRSLDDRYFIIPLEQCSKATLFNMGLIHYHWGGADNAVQFFDLAASLSRPHEATNFDPVILASLNNMAQIHLQFGRAQDAMDMLSDALTRGNAALTTIYSGTGSTSTTAASAATTSAPGNDGDTNNNNNDLDNENDGMEVDEMELITETRSEMDRRRTRRLRRKLARTVLNIGHVHFYRCDYDTAMRACSDAVLLLHTNPEEIEVAAVWYNMALLHYHKGDRMEALRRLEMFLAHPALPAVPDLQVAEAYHRQGKIMAESGKLHDCTIPLNHALSQRQALLGPNHPSVAESLFWIGKVLLQREEFDFALNSLEKAVTIQRAAVESSPMEDIAVSLELAQSLLELGRTYHALGRNAESLAVHQDVLALTKKYFGDRHPFVAQVESIMGNLHLENGNVSASVDHLQDAAGIRAERGLVNVDVAPVDPTHPHQGAHDSSSAAAAGA